MPGVSVCLQTAERCGWTPAVGLSGLLCQGSVPLEVGQAGRTSAPGSSQLHKSRAVHPTRNCPLPLRSQFHQFLMLCTEHRQILQTPSVGISAAVTCKAAQGVGVALLLGICALLRETRDWLCVTLSWARGATVRVVPTVSLGQPLVTSQAPARAQAGVSPRAWERSFGRGPGRPRGAIPAAPCRQQEPAVS